jgi:asparagine synthase (glutamine-hydrolysing)
MWAFAAYDEEDGTLLLSRDRFGEKPLYLYEDPEAPGGLYFGSEVKFIAALAGRRLAVDYDHLYRYLVNGYMSLYKREGTFFEGVREMPQATVLRIGAGGEQRQHRYWTPRYEPDEAMDYPSAVEEARRRLVEAVRIRLRADVPMAFCMSGGIDSNSLIGIARRVFGFDVHGFTIVNTDVRYEEQDHVDAAVRDLGLRHTTVGITPEGFLDNIGAMVRYHDAPVYTISFYLHWLLMRAIHAHGYRISVSGTAADELFTGYYSHHNAYLQAVHGTPHFAPALEAWEAHVGPIVRNPYLRQPRLFIDDPDCRAHIYLNSEAFASYLKAPWHEPFCERRYADDLLRNRMMNECFHESVPVMLHEDDLNAMYFSIENRSPFLDRGLFEHCYRIPSRYLMRDGYQKAVLREAMAGLVPEMVLCNRRKVGINAPVFDFLDVHDPAVRGWLLDDGPIFDHVHRHKIEAITRKDHLPNSESKFLFNFLNAKVFLEQFG